MDWTTEYLVWDPFQTSVGDRGQAIKDIIEMAAIDEARATSETLQPCEIVEHLQWICIPSVTNNPDRWQDCQGWMSSPGLVRIVAISRPNGANKFGKRWQMAVIHDSPLDRSSVTFVFLPGYVIGIDMEQFCWKSVFYRMRHLLGIVQAVRGSIGYDREHDLWSTANELLRLGDRNPFPTRPHGPCHGHRPFECRSFDREPIPTVGTSEDRGIGSRTPDSLESLTNLSENIALSLFSDDDEGGVLLNVDRHDGLGRASSAACTGTVASDASVSTLHDGESYCVVDPSDEIEFRSLASSGTHSPHPGTFRFSTVSEDDQSSEEGGVLISVGPELPRPATHTFADRGPGSVSTSAISDLELPPPAIPLFKDSGHGSVSTSNILTLALDGTAAQLLFSLGNDSRHNVEGSRRAPTPSARQDRMPESWLSGEDDNDGGSDGYESDVDEHYGDNDHEEDEEDDTDFDEEGGEHVRNRDDHRGSIKEDDVDHYEEYRNFDQDNEYLGDDEGGFAEDNGNLDEDDGGSKRRRGRRRQRR